jgi:GNAT superfamily N-acetyltransferase
MAEANYEPIIEGEPQLGSLAVLEWDSSVFGFRVGDWRAGELAAATGQIEEVAAGIERWAVEHEVELIGCSVEANEPLWRAVLPRLGFWFIDATLIYSFPKLHRMKFARSYALRLAGAQDREGVERMAATAFRAGRYHADPRFPVALANRRFERWLSDAFTNAGEGSRIYVTGPEGSATAFTHTRVNGDSAYITIGGADPALQGHGTGAAVFIGTLEALRDSGVRRCQSKLSSANTAMLNLTAFAGAKYSQPQHVYHWHAKNASHLVPAPSGAAAMRAMDEL